MTRRAYGYLDFGKEAVLLPKQKKRVVTLGNGGAMDIELTLFAPVVPAARLSDPSTSNAGIHDVLPRAGSQQHKLLLAFGSRPMGLIAEEAGEIAGLSETGYWKRISELQRAGLIEDTFATRQASTGSDQRVLALTAKGKRAIR